MIGLFPVAIFRSKRASETVWWTISERFQRFQKSWCPEEDSFFAKVFRFLSYLENAVSKRGPHCGPQRFNPSVDRVPVWLIYHRFRYVPNGWQR